MSNLFKIIKLKKICSALIKSTFLGLGVGLASFSIPFAILKLCKVDPRLYILIPVAILAALISGAILFLVKVLCTLRLAKAIDQKFALNEKVQTMIEYQKETATMYQLQRDDASAALKKVSKKASRERGFVVCFTAVLAGIALMASAIVVQPPKEPPEPVITVPFEVTATQLTALEELSKRVRASKMYEPYKENVAVAIDIMIDELKIATTVEERDASINKTLIEILKQTDDSSGACELIVALWGFESRSAKELAKALNYYDSSVFEKYEGFLASFESPRTTTNDEGETVAVPEEEKREALATALQECVQSIQLAVIQSNLPADDPLYVQLITLAPSTLDPVPAMATEDDGYNLCSLIGIIDFIGYDATLEKLDILIQTTYPRLVDAMNEHKINTDTGENAVTQICNLFSISRPAFERPNLYESSTGGDDGGNGPGMGGIGNGTVYGSDDLVYDPYSNTYVEYGVILDKYYDLMFNKTLGEAYTKEEKDALEKYFQILYGGFDNTEKD